MLSCWSFLLTCNKVVYPCSLIAHLHNKTREYGHQTILPSNQITGFNYSGHNYSENFFGYVIVVQLLQTKKFALNWF